MLTPRKLDFSSEEKSDGVVARPSAVSFDVPRTPPASNPMTTTTTPASRKFSSRSPANTVNSGLGMSERRMQLWRPVPILMANQTTASEAYSGAQPRRVSSEVPASPPAPSPTKLPFTGESTSRLAFSGQQPSPEKRPLLSPAPSPTKLPFTGESTSRLAYPGHKPSPQAPWQASPAPSPTKLPFTGESTSRLAFPGHQPSPEQRQQASPAPSPTKLPFTGESTSKLAFPGHRPSPQASRQDSPAPSPSKLPFAGQSTMRQAFPGHVPVPQPNRAYFDGESTRRLPLQGESETHARFKGWVLPPARPALGVELFGGEFHEMLPASREGAALSHTRVFTTCADGQAQVEIRVLASEQDGQHKLVASFELVGIPPQPAAEPQIDVTFALSPDNVLHVSAVDRVSGAAQTIAVDTLANASAFEGAEDES